MPFESVSVTELALTPTPASVTVAVTVTLVFAGPIQMVRPSKLPIEMTGGVRSMVTVRDALDNEPVG